MKSHQNTIAIIALLFFASTVIFSIGSLNAQGDDRVAKIKATLKGKKTSKKRGYKVPGESEAVKSEARMFYSPAANTRGASPMKAFFGDSVVEEVKAPYKNPYKNSKGDLGIQGGKNAYKVEYQVDPTSQLTGEIFFWKGSAKIKGHESHAYLRDLAMALKDPELAHFKFIIEGHASADGNAIFNKRLSQERAYTIYGILVQQYHVNPRQVYPAGFGEDEARYPEYSPERLLAKDRRVLLYKLEK